MSVQQTIENKLKAHFQADYINVENESHNHSVPVNSETHFKVTVVSDEFTDIRLIMRHRLINELLAEELAGPVHALAIHTFTPSQWAEKNQVSPNSPNCLGGGK
ncbi:BolA/IbaG family iron-sulfur metabolism protein [Psychromonas sp. RZ22]|uniref:BolA family protein n=1 Tax=Psychromonas algarum TaxID=2555643 RepID=UPI00106844C3|nr:BolA/IbaG family iron-sulfur metabolism protein [Psychromonas sp. RZ22]TEW53398.1 BolA/IbaG family iron-sulfur metabolism protein [Psychromonas sp. RZ22]